MLTVPLAPVSVIVSTTTLSLTTFIMVVALALSVFHISALSLNTLGEMASE